MSDFCDKCDGQGCGTCGGQIDASITIADLRDRLAKAKRTCAWCRGNVETGDHGRDCPVSRAEKAEDENAKLSQGLHEKTQEVRDLLVLRTENAELRQELALARAANTSLSEIYTLAEGQEPETPLDAVRSLRDDRDSEARWAAQYLAERDKLWAENAKLRDENLLLAGRLAASVCHECGGRGELILDCADPQCGDSTWDHNCTAGRTKPCPNKNHGDPTPHQAYLRAVVELAEAVAAIQWDDAMTYEGNLDASMGLSADQLRAVQAALQTYLDTKKKAGMT